MEWNADRCTEDWTNTRKFSRQTKYPTKWCSTIKKKKKKTFCLNSPELCIIRCFIIAEQSLPLMFASLSTNPIIANCSSWEEYLCSGGTFWNTTHIITLDRSREKGVPDKYFSYFTTKTYVVVTQDHNICLCREIRKISIHFGQRSCLIRSYVW